MNAANDLHHGPPSDEDLRILRHMLGIDDARKLPKPYRNHYCANAGDPNLVSLAQRGLVVLSRPPSKSIPYETYIATEAGIASATSSARRRAWPRKRRVYDRYLDVKDVCPDLTFRDFLVDPEFAEIRRTA